MTGAPDGGAAARARQLTNWVNLSTPLGLMLAEVGGARLRRGPMRLYLAEHYRWSFPTGGAFTVGDVVITRHSIEALLVRHPRMLAHEEAHSRQWAACLGLPFLPMYLLAMGWSWVRTGDRAARCAFERRAGLEDGGYHEVPPRPVLPVVVALSRRVAARVRCWVAGRGHHLIPPHTVGG